jgi:polyhydroxyalkanoate synthesis regulator phasin
VIPPASLEVLARAAILCLKENRECSDELITACRDNAGRIPTRLRRELAELIEKKDRALAEQNAAISKRHEIHSRLEREGARRMENTTRVTFPVPYRVTLPEPRKHSR